MANEPDLILAQRTPRKGRGALSNRDCRYRPRHSEWDDGIAGPSPVTECRPVRAGNIIARNRSPDIPFEQSINPYQGCEHGCIYCYARPTHAYLDLSPGLDFETRLTYKANAAERLRETLARPGYHCRSITLGANTDPYQPVERRYRVTRQVLEVLRACRHPVSIITKGALITRDIDLLADMAADGLVSVAISLTTLDADLKRGLEPRAPSARARLAAMAELSAAGVPVSVLFAPVIPALNDSEMERILAQAREAGASRAAYILLRLPLEIRELFEEWLREHYPLRADHVLSLIRQSRGGRDYDSRFGLRMRGTGPFAELLGQRFRLSCKKLGFNMAREIEARCDLFTPPRPARNPRHNVSAQADLFD
ncbi:PA0069 family radical SAM protein [Parahaliea mediterranea]|uniref:PA0069 family radical SAM protein n=1 Tax=Parahaliea mediterranea TaxID=651086 RepID=A0A939DH56_9GAMM|nr:PA0069 family radical SAM protein [Parahaliea mediterranea]MBN7798111.1 PA0069 family radical SAM protein [Parahaliea mediterranea]